jgi:amino acid transporter
MPYLGQYLPTDNPWIVKSLAVALTVGFAVLNIVGAKETTKLQNLRVMLLAVVLAYFLAQGAFYLAGEEGRAVTASHDDHWLNPEKGLLGELASIGILKRVSVSEEVAKPARNIP